MSRRFLGALVACAVVGVLTGCDSFHPEVLQEDSASVGTEGVDASDELFADPQGNYLSSTQMDTRNKLVDICTNAEDALRVKGVWIYREEPSSFEAALLLALDGKAATPARPGLPSQIQAQPAGLAHLAEIAPDCSAVVSGLQYAASREDLDAALAARSAAGATEPDLTYLSSVVSKITDQG